MTGDMDLDQARWDLQVATGQTVAGTGVEGRMREARAAAGRLAAGLPGLLDELEQLRRTAKPTPGEPPCPAEEIRSEVPKLSDRELADAIDIGDESWFWPVDGEVAQVIDVLRDLQQTRAEVERLSAELADARAQVATVVGQLQQCIDERNYRIGERVAAERALEAVRALHQPIRMAMIGGTETTCSECRKEAFHESDVTWPCPTVAALSAASPTTSDDEPIPMVECNFHGHAHAVGWVGCVSSRRAAGDEPARCDHGHTEAHDVYRPDSGTYAGSCPGPAASSDEPARYDAPSRPEPATDKGAITRHTAADEPARCPHGHTEAHDLRPDPWTRGVCPGPAASGTPETTR